MRVSRSARARALLLASVSAALLGSGCSDFLAAPAHAPAQLSVSYALGGTGGGAAAALEQVDLLYVHLARNGVTVMDSSITVGLRDVVVRPAFPVEVREAEEEMELTVELRWQGRPRFAGSTPVRLVRGARNAAEVTLQPADGTGALVVDVTSAVTGQPLSGATVELRPLALLPVDPGILVLPWVTGAAGTVRVEHLTAGAYTLFVSAPSMIEAVVPGVIVSTNGEAVQRVALSPVLAAGETRIVLTWGANPEDLDSHLTGPDGAGDRFHVYYGSPASLPPSSTSPNVMLDTDKTSGFGPETITIHRQLAGTYCYSVHNFSGGTGLGASGAQVKVFRGSGQVASFRVPSTTRTVWTVFKISGTTLTPVNATGDAEPGVCP